MEIKRKHKKVESIKIESFTYENFIEHFQAVKRNPRKNKPLDDTEKHLASAAQTVDNVLNGKIKYKKAALRRALKHLDEADKTISKSYFRDWYADISKNTRADINDIKKKL